MRTRSWSATPAAYSTVPRSQTSSSGAAADGAIALRGYSGGPGRSLAYIDVVAARWITRLRWRRRGAWLWPAFVVVSVLDGILLHLLPIAGSGTSVLEGILLAIFFNLVAVAVLGGLVGLWLRRRRPDLPKMVARNYGGTIVLGGVAVLLVIGGVLHAPEIERQEQRFARQAAAVRAYVGHSAPREYRGGVNAATTWQLEDDYFRTCVPGPDPRRELCMFVDTSEDPPSVREDHNRAPNRSYVGPGFGRR